MDRTRSADPLRTLELLVGVIVSVMALLAGLVLLGTIVGTGTIPGVNAEVCASTGGDAPAFRRTEGDSTGPVGLGEGITWRADEVQICDPDPDGGTRGLAADAFITRVCGVSVAISSTSLVRITSTNFSRSLTGTTNAPGPPITQSS